MEPRISVITLGVRDLVRAIHFYRDGLGFQTQVEHGAPIAFFTTSGTRLALYPLTSLAAYVGSQPPLESGRFGGITLTHFVRTKKEVAEVLASAAQAGGKIVKPAQDVFWGGHAGFFSDPDGHCWEVAWAPMFKFGENGSVIFPGKGG
jgi:uncharacterized protein